MKRLIFWFFVAFVAVVGYGIYLNVVNKPDDPQVIELKTSWADLEASVAGLVNTLSNSLSK
jgi:hypothetical protein